jgi:aryl-alcohol dehydrogenase-like predicted oxidoreductase
LALDQGVGTVVWSPLGWGRLSGKYRRSHPIDATSRAVQNGNSAPPVPEERLYEVMDVLDQLAAETGHSVPQIALNWVLSRPSVATVIIGARNEAQLVDNLEAVGWSLTAAQMAQLDAASEIALPYPQWHQSGFRNRNPAPVPERGRP